MRDYGRAALRDTSTGADVVVERGDTETRIIVAGELDFTTVGHVRSAIEAECKRRPETLGIDLAAVEFADSHALRLFVATHRNLERQGCRLVLIHPSEQVVRLLAITRLDELLRVRPAVRPTSAPWPARESEDPA